MAFGTVGDQTKFYFYALEAPTNAVLLVELVIAAATNAATATIKASAPQPVAAFSAILKAECGIR